LLIFFEILQDCPGESRGAPGRAPEDRCKLQSPQPSKRTLLLTG
jgi:hypothetical protein